MQGAFITFEGGDGAGKTSIIKMIADELAKQNFHFVLTREPGGTEIGEEIRKLLLKHHQTKMSSMTELCLFLAARAQHIEEKIVPLLHENTIILCDRYNDSSVAYQGYARELGMEEVIGFSSYVVNDVEPDLTLYLDIDPQEGLKRVSKYSKKNRYDRIESETIVFHQKIREGFHLLARKYPHRFRIIDASMPIEDVFVQCYEHVDQTLRELGW